MLFRRPESSSPPLGQTTPRAFVFIAICFVLAADAVAETVIRGTPVAIDTTSVKCEMDEIEGVSSKRLVDCDSALLVEVTHADGTERGVRFVISPFDEKISSGTRAELRDMHESVNGDQRWYRFSTLLPKDFPMDAEHRLVLAQWHERMREGVDSLRPPLSHRLWNGRFVITLWNNRRVAERGAMGDGEILYEEPLLETGVFHEYVYKVVWSPRDDGELVVWHRPCPLAAAGCADVPWRLIVDYRGSTGYDDSDIVGYYFKLGLYTVSKFDVPFTVFHRDYRAGASAADVGFDAARAD